MYDVDFFDPQNSSDYSWTEGYAIALPISFSDDASAQSLGRLEGRGLKPPAVTSKTEVPGELLL